MNKNQNNDSKKMLLSKPKKLQVSSVKKFMIQSNSSMNHNFMLQKLKNVPLSNFNFKQYLSTKQVCFSKACKYKFNTIF